MVGRAQSQRSADLTFHADLLHVSVIDISFDRMGLARCVLGSAMLGLPPGVGPRITNTVAGVVSKRNFIPFCLLLPVTVVFLSDFHILRASFRFNLPR